MNNNYKTSRKSSSSLFALAAGLLVLGAAETARAGTDSCIFAGECAQQSGSYAAVCAANSDIDKKYGGTSCGSICDVDWEPSDNVDLEAICMGGCFSHYSSSKSWDNLASTYTCSIPTPTLSWLHMYFDTTNTDLVAEFEASNGHTTTDDSDIYFYGATDSSGSGKTLIQAFYYGSQNYINYSNPSNSYAYYQVCVTPRVAGYDNWDTLTATGTQGCTGWGNASERITSTASVSISGNTVTGTYTYSDNEGAAEETANETYMIQRADDSAGTTNKTTLVQGTTSSAKTWTLTSSENDRYVRFCVIPASVNRISTSWHCSGWTYVGSLLEMYQDTNYGGSSLNIAYTQSGSGHCFNLTDYSFNDEMSSFQVGTGSSAITLTFYWDINCSGSSWSNNIGANGWAVCSDVGSSWNDKASSFKVTW